jgi:hypothetical protein
VAARLNNEQQSGGVLKLSHRFTVRKSRLLVAAALGGTALTLSSPATIAAIVDSGVVNLPVPQTTAGLYINLVTGVLGFTAGAVPGWDFNPFGSTNISFFSSAGTGTQTVGAATTATALAPGATIGPGSTYANVGTTGTAATAFRNTGVAYVGFKFTNEATATVNYGYALMSTTTTSGYPAAVVRYVYDDTGAPITIPITTGLFRAYLDPSGSDGNPCTLGAPCRLLPAALAAVADGGEIWMLDSANYNVNTVTITKSVTILAVPGALGSFVTNAGGPALSISAPGGRVALRNAVIVPLPGGGGTNGIEVNSATGLTLENCLVAGVAGTGVVVAAPAIVSITDSTLRDNGRAMLLESGTRTTVARTKFSGNGSSAILVSSSVAGTTTRADIGDSTFDANGYALYVRSSNATASVSASIRNSQVVRHASAGVVAESQAGASANVAASGNTVSNNATGLYVVGAGARMWASGNTVSENNLGLHNNTGGVFESALDNALNNNATPTSGVISPVVKF